MSLCIRKTNMIFFLTIRNIKMSFKVAELLILGDRISNGKENHIAQGTLHLVVFADTKCFCYLSFTTVFIAIFIANEPLKLTITHFLAI